MLVLNFQVLCYVIGQKSLNENLDTRNEVA